MKTLTEQVQRAQQDVPKPHPRSDAYEKKLAADLMRRQHELEQVRRQCRCLRVVVSARYAHVHVTRLACMLRHVPTGTLPCNKFARWSGELSHNRPPSSVGQQPQTHPSSCFVFQELFLHCCNACSLNSAVHFAVPIFWRGGASGFHLQYAGANTASARWNNPPQGERFGAVTRDLCHV